MAPAEQATRQLLAERRAQLRRELDAAFAQANAPASIVVLDAALQALERAEERIAQPRRATILLGLSSGLMAASIIGVGLYFTLSEVRFRLQAEAWAVTVTAGGTGAYGLRERNALLSGGTFDVEEIRLLTSGKEVEERLSVRRIEELRVTNGTTFNLVVEPSNCLLFAIPGSSMVGQGAVIQLGVMTEAQSSGPPPDPHELRPGHYARFCGIDSTDPLLIGDVEAVSFTRVYREDTPRLEASTIFNGTLSIAEVGDRHDLLPTDRLVLENLRAASFVVRLVEDTLLVTMDGRAADPRIFKGAPTLDGQTLLPNLLTYATQSPPALLLGMAIGLVGTIWNILRLFTSSRWR